MWNDSFQSTVTTNGGTTNTALSAVVAHQDELIRAGLESLLTGRALLRQLELCADWPTLSALLAAHGGPDVLIVAHRFFREDDTRISEIRSRAARIIVLLENVDSIELAHALRLQPDGFLVERGLTGAILTHALRQAMYGQVLIAPQLASETLAELQNPKRISLLGLRQLTPREHETLMLLGEGRSNKQIANRLGISINGAKRHVANVLTKLNCPNRTLAAAEAIRLGAI